MLPLILRLVNSKYISNVQEHRHGNLVFFDFLGAFIISGKEIVATVVNVAVAAASIYSIWHNMKYAHSIHRKFLIEDMICIERIRINN